MIDYGFVWSDVPGQQLGNTDYVSLGSRSNTGTFSARIERALEEGKTHYVRAYAKSSENTVYGPVQEFASLGSKAPLVESFEPKTGTWGDTIQIKGKNFSQVNDKNRVLIGEVATKLVFSSDTLLKVVVPEGFVNSTGKFKVVLAGNAAESNDFFGLESALINGFKPDSANYGVPFSITGSLFSKNFTKVYFNDLEIDAISVSDSLNTITLEVPKGLPVGFQDVKVVIGNRTIIADKKFFRATPLIKNITPTTATYGETVSITGRFFSPDLDDNLVKIYANDPRYYYEAQILESTAISINAKVPNVYMGYGPKIAIEVNEELSNALTLNIARPIIESITPSSGLLPGDMTIVTGKNFPKDGHFDFDISGVSVDERNIEVNSNQRLTFLFPPDIKSHVTQLNAYLGGKIGSYQITTPLILLTHTSSNYGSQRFLEGENIIVYNSLVGEIFWKYSLVDDQWFQLPSMSTSSNLKNFFVFHFPESMYAGGGSRGNIASKDFYRYFTNSDSWEQLESSPVAGRVMASYSLGLNGYALWAVFDGFRFSGRYELWKFDSETESWSLLAPFTFETSNGVFQEPIYFVSHGELFFTTVYYDDRPAPEPLWHFNLTTLQWAKSEIDALAGIRHVAYKGKSYIIANDYGTNNTRVYEIDKASLKLVPSTFPDIPTSLLKEKTTIESGNDLFLINQSAIWKYDPLY
ncbi:MAG: IPT/TIG domain-containing protein [Imperialibacter sp.]|uniref:IPT/TIG domain-containing protein n=1 Tax=Imperialibacter sp. TaxID=2038411 RepID=UPI0032EBF546